MGGAVVIGVIGLTAIIAAASGSKEKKPEKTDAPAVETDDSLKNEIPIVIPPKVDNNPAPKPKDFNGKFPLTVEVNRSNLGGFRADRFIKSFVAAAKKGDYATIISLSSGLNKDKIRAIHNEFLEETKGASSIYKYVVSKNTKIPILVKKTVIEFLTNAGVGSRVKKNRSSI